MPGSKRNEIRAAVQQRVKRFSAFELLGLEGGSSPSPTSPLDSPSVRPSDRSDHGISDRDVSDSLTGRLTIPLDQPSDRLPYPQTVPSDQPSDPHISDHLIDGQSKGTSDHLIDGQGDISTDSSVPSATSEAIPLAPLQWRVWQALLKTEGKVISHQGLAAQTTGSIPGVRLAIRVIEKEGGILFHETVREKTQEGAILQGFRVALNHAVAFRQISSKESHRLQKRGLSYPHIAGGRIYPPSDPSDGLRMYVRKRLQTYIPELLRLCPSSWNIREQTLVQIAETFPEMSLLEFRRSFILLAEQAKNGPAIQHPNAWLKAAFEKNGGPLVTEREIEARFDQQETNPPRQESGKQPHKGEDEDLSILRQYLGANAEEKVQIDQMAEERVERMLATLAPDKHAGIREQARLECAREFFANVTQKS